MVDLIVIDRAGCEHNFKATPGKSLMESIRDQGIYDIKALCGGSCSCATCHVYVDSDTPLAVMSEDENDLLDGTSERQANSRLSCQITLIRGMDPLHVVIAPED
ncbi:ferredoxin, 2Fe-2S [Acidocella aminolytica 101 = DSM 11237]|uniref:Ferredoxin 2Fe-2S n=1 Tax=Acidocella aminolytica 101 = DSM 11237 TaxID=1120923 RepID=A0A0D6PJF5_9PROT|nr:ferredoxin 2Fe-2S [Acidocella aminolytica 101 = DSM 11237]GBQ43302.1 ferredoxin [Acidocella aminolytica 101 = DSM 11237]SHF31708.1 ferredoxin, 2Fe-2S [Acidocella aminolytica 101 = DSM 11237]